jgi:hypothetical protein
MGYKTESLINRWENEMKKEKQQTQDKVLKEFFETDLGKKIKENHEKHKEEQKKIRKLYDKLKNKKEN